MEKHTLSRTVKFFSLLLALVLPITLFAGCSRVVYNENFTYSDALDDNGFFKDLKASKYVTLPDYKGIPIPAEIFEASEEALQEQIDSILANYTKYEEITDRAVEDGDTLNIDYVGSMDGIEFEGGSTNGMGTVVTIGVTSYIDDFLEQLIGHNPGETFDIEVTFPDPYPNNPDFANKDATFTVTINYIQGDALETELNNAIAIEYGFESKDELLSDISSWLIEQQKLEFFNGVIAQATCDKIPDSVINYIMNSDMKYYKNYAESYGMSLDEFLATYVGYDSIEAYIEEQRASYEESAITYLAVQAIAEAEGLSVSMDDIAAAGMDSYLETYGVGYIKQYLLQSSIVPTWVADNAIPE